MAAATLVELTSYGTSLFKSMIEPNIVGQNGKPVQVGQYDIRMAGKGIRADRVRIFSSSTIPSMDDQAQPGTITLLFRLLPCICPDSRNYVFMGHMEAPHPERVKPVDGEDPEDNPAYIALNQDPVTCFAGHRFGLHCANPRDVKVAAHIKHGDIECHHKSPVSCVLEFLHRLGSSSSSATLGQALAICPRAFTALCLWVSKHDTDITIPGQGRLSDMLDKVPAAWDSAATSHDCQCCQVPDYSTVTRKRKRRRPPPTGSAAGGVSMRTSYLGVTYASRLEARWAHLFTKLDIRFRYESLQLRSNRMPQLLGNGGTYYKPDMWLVDQQMAVEIKPGPPSRQERMLCVEFTRWSGTPIVLLWGSPGIYPTVSTRSYAAIGEDTTATTTREPPQAILFVRDPRRVSEVRAESVYLARRESGPWGFHNVADIDQLLDDPVVIDHLALCHRRAGEYTFENPG